MTQILFNQSSEQMILNHLKRVSPLFKPMLSSYVDLPIYAKKIFEKANRIEVWNNGCLIGLIAYYLNIEESFAFITNVSLEKEFVGRGIATQMMEMLYIKTAGKIKVIKLEVKSINSSAINFYNKLGFKAIGKGYDFIEMEKQLNRN